MSLRKQRGKDAQRVVSKIVRDFRMYQRANAKNTRVEQAIDLGRWARFIARDLGITSMRAIGDVNNILQGLWYAEWVRETAQKRNERRR